MIMYTEHSLNRSLIVKFYKMSSFGTWWKLFKEVAHCFDYSWILNFMSYIERDSKDTPIPKFPVQLDDYSSL